MAIMLFPFFALKSSDDRMRAGLFLTFLDQ